MLRVVLRRLSSADKDRADHPPGMRWGRRPRLDAVVTEEVVGVEGVVV